MNDRLTGCLGDTEAGQWGVSLLLQHLSVAPLYNFHPFFSWPEDTIFHLVCSFCEVGLNRA